MENDEIDVYHTLNNRNIITANLDGCVKLYQIRRRCNCLEYLRITDFDDFGMDRFLSPSRIIHMKYIYIITLPHDQHVGVSDAKSALPYICDGFYIIQGGGWAVAAPSWGDCKEQSPLHMTIY